MRLQKTWMLSLAATYTGEAASGSLVTSAAPKPARTHQHEASVQQKQVVVMAQTGRAGGGTGGWHFNSAPA